MTWGAHGKVRTKGRRVEKAFLTLPKQVAHLQKRGEWGASTVH